MGSISKSTDLFSSKPVVCFQYGPKEFIVSTHDRFKVDDAVVWNVRRNVEPHFGKIEFLGKELQNDVTQNSSGTADIAVVTFSQPTCHLPGHIINPPKNRNLVPVNQLVSQNACRLTLDATIQIFNLIGNCIATKQGFSRVELENFQTDGHILAKTANKSINGKILTTGIVTDTAINSGVLCVGVKFESSLNLCKPDIAVTHHNTSQICKECAGDTLAFVPLKMLTYCETSDCTTYQPMTNPSPFVSPSQSKSVSVMKIDKPDNPVLQLFVGNCVAHEKGIQKLALTDLPLGANVLARTKKTSLEGVIRITCTINDFGGEKFVGIEFKLPFDDLDDSINVRHTGLRGRSPKTCEKCKSGKLVLVSEMCFSLHFAKIRNDIVFQVL